MNPNFIALLNEKIMSLYTLLLCSLSFGGDSEKKKVYTIDPAGLSVLCGQGQCLSLSWFSQHLRLAQGRILKRLANDKELQRVTQ